MRSWICFGDAFSLVDGVVACAAAKPPHGNTVNKIIAPNRIAATPGTLLPPPIPRSPVVQLYQDNKKLGLDVDRRAEAVFLYGDDPAECPEVQKIKKICIAQISPKNSSQKKFDRSRSGGTLGLSLGDPCPSSADGVVPG
jgi:hypothetical protein